MTISRQIEAELKNHAIDGEIPPYRLTLTAMADHFGVSIQPVRTAVEALLREGWMARNGQGQLIFNPEMKGCRESTAVAPAPASADVETALMNTVIRYSLRGESLFMREEESAEQFGVGRSVVRAILTRLSGKGVVEHVPRRGWRVCAFSEVRMQEYLDVREVLELRALEMAAGRLDRQYLEHLMQLNTPTKRGGVRIDNTLHEYWVRQANNHYISEFFALHGQYYSSLFDYASLETVVLADMAAQHRAILASLIDGRLKEAQRLLREHIRSQHPNVGRLMENLTEIENVNSQEKKGFVYDG